MNKILCIFILFLTCLTCFAENIIDEVADCLPREVLQPYVYNNYNFESTVKIPINLKIIDPIKSENDLYEGQVINFKIAKDVIYNDKIVLKRGTAVMARVSIIITPGMNGIPASIIFKDFEIEGVSKGQLTNTYEIFGQDRSLLVFPLKWALTILPPTGSLTNFIMGGHARLKTKKQITIYYYPNWL